MGRCSCSGASSCACVIDAGEGILVRGAGTLSNPYVIENSSVVERYIQTLDTPSLDLVLEGGGTPANPFILSGESTLALTELTDVGEGQVPTAGDVPVWVVDHWEFQPPPGAVTADGTSITVATGAGVTGSGTGANPIQAAVSGVWGSGSMANFPVDKTLGTPIYTDDSGQLRARPVPVVRFAVNPLGSYGSGWGANGGGTVFWYQMGNLVYFRAAVTRTGSTITAGSTDGNIANQEIGTLAAALPKPMTGEWPAQVSNTGAMMNVYTDGNRKLMLSALPTNQKVTTSTDITIVGFYLTDAVGVVL